MHARSIITSLTVFIGCATAASLPANSTPPATHAELEEGPYTSLFNGADLAGWRKVGGGATYTVEDGCIVGTVGPGPNTFLRTERTYADFELRLEVKLDVPGNSGIQFRSHQRGGDGRVYGYQCEIDPSDRAWSGGIYDEGRRGWLAPLEGKDEARRAFRIEGWNEYRILASGNHLHTWVNGIACAHLHDIADSEGFIALQVHSGKEGRIRWRNIRIREIAARGDVAIADHAPRRDTARPERRRRVDATRRSARRAAAAGSDNARARRAQTILDPLADHLRLATESPRSLSLERWPGKSMAGAASGPRPLTEVEQARFEKGRRFYRALCITCHQKSGQGMSGIAPSIVGTPRVLGREEPVVLILLHGMTGPVEVAGKKFNASMPKAPVRRDETLSAVLTYVRRAWGNDADPISPETIARLRDATTTRMQPYTAAELDELE